MDYFDFWLLHQPLAKPIVLVVIRINQNPCHMETASTITARIKVRTVYQQPVKPYIHRQERFPRHHRINTLQVQLFLTHLIRNSQVEEIFLQNVCRNDKVTVTKIE